MDGLEDRWMGRWVDFNGCMGVCVVRFDGLMCRLACICVGYDGMMDVVFVFNIPPTAKAIWRHGHSLK